MGRGWWEANFVHGSTSCTPSPCTRTLLQKADGQLAFRGLVATPDGKKVYETARTGALTGGFAASSFSTLCHVLSLTAMSLAIAESDAVAIGRDAGEQLKAEAKADGTVFDW
jgi:hypothetical protein